MPLSLPVYFLGRTFVLHTRIAGRQIKRSLKTADPRVAKLRAIEILRVLSMAVNKSNPSLSYFNFDLGKLRRYEIDLKNGVLKASDAADHKLMMEALDRLGPIPGGWPKSGADSPVAAPEPKKSDMTLSGLLEKFLALKGKTTAATVTDYKATVKQFEDYAKKPPLSRVGAHITGYMEWLAARGNTERTIDKKIGTLRALINFGRKHEYFTGDNPAAERNLLTRKQKNASGHKFYQLNDVKQVFDCEHFRAYATTEPNFHLIAVAGLLTGVRVSALAALTLGDLKTSLNGGHYLRIQKDKTVAGIRNVPIPAVLFNKLHAFLTEKGSFGFNARSDGKGSSDPVRKILNEHLAAVGMAGQDFTFHGLRKTLNSVLIKEKVPLEARCQFIGHEIEHVNVAIYGEQMPLEELAALVVPVQEKLMGIIGFA